MSRIVRAAGLALVPVAAVSIWFCANARAMQPQVETLAAAEGQRPADIQQSPEIQKLPETPQPSDIPQALGIPQPLDIPQPIAWPQKPVLSCRARVEYARQFLIMMKQGLPEQRIHFASDWESKDELAEILEIRRRAYHDRAGLNEVLACATEKEI